MGKSIPLIVDGGPTPVGLELTIVKVEGDRVRLLRPGGVAAEEIEAIVGKPLLREGGSEVVAPGMLASHYAPQAAVRLEAREVKAGEALLDFGPAGMAGAENAVGRPQPLAGGDLREAAVNFFSMLQELDRSGAATIAVAPIPLTGLGEAINDRLSRAAAPRDLASEANRLRPWICPLRSTRR